MKTMKLLAACVATMTAAACGGGAGTMSGNGGSIDSIAWGEVEGREVRLYTLRNTKGLVAKITNYGTIVTELHVPDRIGNLGDIVLGFDTLQGYLDGHPYFGATAGRVANRIALGKFTVGGQEYSVATNNAPNHLHGGDMGFDKYVWDAVPSMTNLGPSLRLTRTSPDGEEGYPGKLKASVTYTLTNDDSLRVFLSATTDKETIVNLAHHSYWNLAGHASGNILNHELRLYAANYTPVDDTMIPTGEIATVKGTPYDFTQSKPIGREMAQIGGDPGGYDHNFVLDGEKGTLRHAATVTNFASGRVMELHTTEPGIQFYTGNFLDGSNTGKGGAVYNKNQAFCLETQKYPDAVNKPDWPSPILKPGQAYTHLMVHKFRAK